MTDPLLSVQNARVSLGTAVGVTEAVRDVSYEVNRGETPAVVGESSSGKSVTAQAIMERPAPNTQVGAGTRIPFDGDDLSEWSEPQRQDIRRRRNSMIFQERLTSLNPVYRIGDQFGEIVTSDREIGRTELRAEVIRLLTEVQLPNPEGRFSQYPHEMSGGQRQRVMIAMALANNPDLRSRMNPQPRGM